MQANLRSAQHLLGTDREERDEEEEQEAEYEAPGQASVSPEGNLI